MSQVGMDWRGDGHGRRRRGWPGIAHRLANVVAWIVCLLLPITLFVFGFVLYKTPWVPGARGAGNALMLVGVALGGVMILVVTRSPMRTARQAQGRVQRWPWPHSLGLRLAAVGHRGQAWRRRSDDSRVVLAVTLHEQVVAPLDVFAVEQGLTREEAVNRILAERLGEPDPEG